MGDNHRLTIKQVSQITGIPPYTLRFWEKQFSDFLKPFRTNGGQRRYSGEDISIIERIKAYKKEGKPLAEIQRNLFRNKSNSSDLNRIDLLANKIAKIVKAEVYNFFKMEKR
ncbi:MAG: MerR family transcriptional regulator [Deltaproteobacteria bacterium]|nr:MerR family transcriptional regulator [Deltaproteobacteria bacterium]MBW2018920.1 MerR family transcriptional regulator [Deltaproteobacteria bacterium]MBW2073135.1 MerR family transcriptional regulator [Deltaproteobacteria bacterium]